jgi:phage/plasmid-like protein (TIGR03299 family)
MAHEIYKDNMVYQGEMPWHGIGKPIEMNITGPELIEKLDLSKVGKRPLYTLDRNGSYIPVTTHQATVRSKDDIVLGCVGNGYEVIQDEETIMDLDTLRVQGLATFETAALLRDATRFFVMMAITEGKIALRTPNGKEDLVYSYLCASHGHDGTLAYEFTPTNIRVVCANTMGMARAQGKKDKVSFYIKHTKNAEYRIAQAIKAYKETIEFNKEFAEYAQTLVDTRFGGVQLTKYVEALFPPKDDGEITGAALKGRHEVARLFVEGKGHQELAIVGTAWGALNAAHEYYDWVRPTKGMKDFAEEERQAAMWEATQFSSQLVNKKIEALTKLQEVLVS